MRSNTTQLHFVYRRDQGISVHLAYRLDQEPYQFGQFVNLINPTVKAEFCLQTRSRHHIASVSQQKDQEMIISLSLSSKSGTISLYLVYSQDQSIRSVNLHYRLYQSTRSLHLGHRKQDQSIRLVHLAYRQDQAPYGFILSIDDTKAPDRFVLSLDKIKE